MSLSKLRAARPQIDCSEDTPRTKQEFAEECDINNILAKFRKTGVVTHLAKHAPRYGDATLTSYEEAMLTVAEANTMWEECPSHIRQEFGSIEQFLQWQENATIEDIKEKFGELPPSFAEPEADRPTDEPTGESSGEAASSPSSGNPEA